MDEIEIALQYAKEKKIARYKKEKLRRYKARLNSRFNFNSTNSLETEQSITKKFTLMKLPSHNEKDFIEIDVSCGPTESLDTNGQITDNINQLCTTSDILDFSDLVPYQEKKNSHLHQYTSVSCFLFSHNLIDFIRKANISKTHAEHLINLIQSVLPQPNTLPDDYAGILNLLSVENLFIKRLICLNCKTDLAFNLKNCPKCTNNHQQRLAIVHDALQDIMFTRIYDRLRSNIDLYREKFQKQSIDDETNDIVFNQNYKKMCDCINYPFISIILHIDGINLSESSNQTLWVLSCSIIEVPPALRVRRQNNLILSMWTATEQPIIELWLDRCFKQLANLKLRGKSDI
ncbi:unnamed protein product [Rotaria sordida]|uniref:Uncharacterized protein n=1 Tax=Rotaria sordida TaxID=392033 RepID=A0A815CMT5_9BILA|nr:unnamed protein product [Rotaria sordida]